MSLEVELDLKVVLLGLFAFIAACGANDPADKYPQAEKFAFCVPNPEAAARVKKMILSVAQGNAMTVHDRSAGVQHELENLPDAKPVLAMTNGAPIMLTIERQNYLEIFLSNVGSGKEMTLAARYVSSARPDALEGLIKLLGSQFELRPYAGDGVPARCA